MPTSMTFVKVKQYLNAIADNPNSLLSVDNSPHGRFWNVPYSVFTSGNVPGGAQTQCGGSPTPIIDQANPAQSAFLQILTGAGGFCTMPQMPEGGPFITDPNYQVTLSDGTTVTGAQISQDLLEWLDNGFPE